MPSALPDVFDRFAAQTQLHLHTEPVVTAPRDVLADLDETEMYYLATVTSRASGASVRMVFIRPTTEHSPPVMRDILWWLAADAWAVEQSGREVGRWAGTYGYPVASDATARLYEMQVAQSAALASLLGRDDYARLLALYDAEVTREGKV